ncbi:hypothetical protein LCGC14_2343800 [marine sediment metagenome]|uniref:Nucleotide-diphospho-sugar transferase domain-containing protein n=1 Tax=marine sediment metagenome TaxID=412755 RepID=A0A0F9CC10_9ZZZZ
MKNLIYQYYDGKLLPGDIAGSANIKEYAARIGAEYLFEHDPKFVTNLGTYSPHYGSFKPIYTESFHEYDNILFTDTDVFAVEGLTENIFENFKAEIGICTEPFQPTYRAKVSGNICGAMDERWATTIKTKWNVEMPRTKEGLLKVYNSGVVLYSNKGLVKAKEKFVPFVEYVNLVNTNKISNFYTADQNYLHAMLTVAEMDYIELDNEWNRAIHYIVNDNDERVVNDMRTEKTKFVHIHLRGANHWDVDKHYRITNLPIEEWGL